MTVFDERRFLRELLRQFDSALEELQRQIVIRTPVDTGRLRSSITKRGPILTRDNNIEGFVGTNVEYAPYVEYGHMSVGGRWVPGRHMFARGKEASDPRIRKLLGRGIRSMIEVELKRGLD